jgi:hypothetical protein
MWASGRCAKYPGNNSFIPQKEAIRSLSYLRNRSQPCPSAFLKARPPRSR